MGTKAINNIINPAVAVIAIKVISNKAINNITLQKTTSPPPISINRDPRGGANAGADKFGGK